MTNYAKHETDEQADLVRETLSYDPERGILIRVKTFGNRQDRVSKPAGNVRRNKTGGAYRQVSVGKRSHYSHRVCYLLYYGHWPNGQLDHIDHDGLNNKIDNLRVVTQSENLKNAPMRIDNTSGHVGVTWHKGRKKWQAGIIVNRSYHFLGRFDDIDLAVSVRKQAEIEFGYHKNHGNPR